MLARPPLRRQRPGQRWGASAEPSRAAGPGPVGTTLHLGVSGDRFLLGRAGSREARLRGSSGREAPAQGPRTAGWRAPRSVRGGRGIPGQGEAYLRAARGGRRTAGAAGLRAAGLQLSDPPSRGEVPRAALCASFYPQSVIAASSLRGKEGGGGRRGRGELGEGAAGRGQLRKAPLPSLPG